MSQTSEPYIISSQPLMPPTQGLTQPLSTIPQQSFSPPPSQPVLYSPPQPPGKKLDVIRIILLVLFGIVVIAVIWGSVWVYMYNGSTSGTPEHTRYKVGQIMVYSALGVLGIVVGVLLILKH